LRLEIFLILLQSSATVIRLDQNGQTFYDNQAHKANLPKMGKCLAAVFPNPFLASAPFSEKQISITLLPCLAHMSTQFSILHIWDV